MLEFLKTQQSFEKAEFLKVTRTSLVGHAEGLNSF